MLLAFAAVGCGGSDSSSAPPGGDQDGAPLEDTSAADGAGDVSIDDTGGSPADGTTGDAESDTGSPADSGAADGSLACDEAGACPFELSCCGGACVDTSSSAAHCGACGTVCTGGGEICAEGKCACPGPFSGVCSGTCTDLTKAPNCGACGTSCATGTSCVAPVAPAAPGCAPGCFADLPQIVVPGAPVRVGYAISWGAARSIAPASGDRGAIHFDDATGKIASMLANVPAVAADAAGEVTRIQGLVKPALGTGTTDVAVGVATTSHEGHTGAHTTYAVARATTASDLRDAVAAAVLGGAVAPPTTKVGTSTTFLVTLTTIYRADVKRTDVMVAIAPRVDADSRTSATILRIGDLTNTTAMAATTMADGFGCQLLAGANPPKADILWTVDTSGSMSDDQNRIGNAGKGIFDRLRLAGVDFRMAVITAGSQAPNLDTPGFTWIQGTDADGPNELCRRVTYAQCPLTAAETKTPYPMAGGLEEPTAAAVLTHFALWDRGKKGETNPDKKLRDGARFVTFHVTDEPGSNDFTRYFATKTDPQTAKAWGTTYNATTLANIVDYFVRNQIITFGILPAPAAPCTSYNVYDLPRSPI
ncbi:MAG: hypothetical protein HYV09_07140 [Deltaproteobacteria bacterium]|nr:hypothetical protein [Deltaproteobacteria bacterium]